MSTIEDFENAPVGATATHRGGSRVMKMDDIERRWVTSNGVHLNDEEVEQRGFTLDPLWPVPITAREALDLAWELAHEVKPGQVIPKGTRYLEVYGSEVREYAAPFDLRINPGGVPLRTLEPLPDPEPDWLNAPAVISVCNDDMDRSVFVREGDNWWVSKNYAADTDELRDVTPLWPKGQDA